jgi:hypothetical protein
MVEKTTHSESRRVTRITLELSINDIQKKCSLDTENHHTTISILILKSTYIALFIVEANTNEGIVMEKQLQRSCQPSFRLPGAKGEEDDDENNNNDNNN